MIKRLRILRIYIFTWHQRIYVILKGKCVVKHDQRKKTTYTILFIYFKSNLFSYDLVHVYSFLYIFIGNVVIKKLRKYFRNFEHIVEVINRLFLCMNGMKVNVNIRANETKCKEMISVNTAKKVEEIRSCFF